MTAQEILIAQVTDTVESVEKAALDGEIAEYFEDTLDVKITIGGDLKYCGVRIATALGGPGVFIDTNTGEVNGYWGGDEYTRTLSNFALTEIDNYFEDYYNTCR